MRILAVMLAVVVFAVGFAWALCQIPGVIPPCQNTGFALTSAYTGDQIVNGRRVHCFAGQIVSVGPRVGQ